METLEVEKLEKARSSWSMNNMWDCGSTLYDSFELNSFKRQLDSAIARTLSMPHLPDRRVPLQPPPNPAATSSSKKSFRISRSLQKFIRSVFKSNNNKSTVYGSTSPFFQAPENSTHRFYEIKSGPMLSTIPEHPEFEIGGLSPDITSLVGRSASERFTATAIGISCA